MLPLVAMAADASPASTAATEHSDAKPLLSEVLNQESGQAGEHDLRVLHARLVDYLYPWQGKQVEAQKVQVLFQSYRPEEYCLGVAKLQRKDKKELKLVLEKFAVTLPSKEQHTADLYIESMEPIAPDRVEQAIAMVKQLKRVSTFNHGNAATSTEAAWQQKKCRRMERYPTLE